MRAAEHLLASGREGDFEALLQEAVEREQQRSQGPPDVFNQIQALCSLAELKVQQAAAERDRGQRVILLSNSTKLCHRAQYLNMEEQLPELVLGAVALAKNEAMVARKAFEKAMRMRCNGRPSIAPHLALANLHFNQRNYTDALRLYKQALRSCPSCPPEVRLGIAACCLKMGNTDKAELAYKRTLELAPDCTPALLGLAVLKLHISSEEEAFEQDPDNPFVLLLLAHFCLRQGFSDKAFQLDPKLPLPKLGLAQMRVMNNEPQEAASILESVLIDAPQWIDALEVLGRVYPKTTSKSKVVPQFKEAAALRPKNVGLWELLGDLLASLEPAGALKAYDKAIELRRAAAQADGVGSSHLPPRLLNNAAVLHLRAGNTDVSYSLMTQAMQSAARPGSTGVNALVQVTLGYNLARVKEACGSLKAAEVEYKELLKQFPQYGDCCLRLACIAKARGDTKASGHLCLFTACSIQEAGMVHEQVLDKLLEQTDSKQEMFAKLAMANLHAYSAPSDRRKEDSAKKAEVHYSHALELYRRVLEKDEGCIFAANGVGCVLAELGNLTAAKEVFLQVQEASAASDGFLRMPDAWINLANVYLAQEQYTAAIQMYKNALRKFYDNRSALVMLYLARAQYDADQLPEAKCTLTKALHLAPTDHKLRFDVAVTMQACVLEWAVRTLQKKRPAGDPSRYEDFRRAVRDLEHAHRFFQYLHSLGRGHQLDTRKLQQHINFVAKTHGKALAHLERAREDAQKAAQRQAAAQAEKNAQETSKRLAEERRKAEEGVQRRKQEEQARGNVERLRQLQEQWRTNATMQKAVAAGDATAVQKVNNDAAAAAVNAQVDALFASSEEDEDYNPENPDDLPDFDAGGGAAQAGAAAPELTAEPAAGVAGDLEDDFDSDFDMDEGGADAGAAEPPAKRAKHQAVLDSDDEVE
ncbi:hypothetical protein CHLNCDRAFT_139104 [Chlorella variabilis]|uniref:Uncharacterized protein n=1 Tax=Chlorella variabilis TaxID=554065 RepID=E1ZPD5_CHLVA|nr:hypothetical protein CHLNCDRAFT_139104 [Chlorella variabilis]EFN52318.1 hypothetical protein CHLNCDRAFT_139104 [Chlorella variabilis]|eukprot:XP_005844420.1 hypothetical protein CHLNCDRAFT_139104 [Chlorella variabilis]